MGGTMCASSTRQSCRAFRNGSSSKRGSVTMVRTDPQAEIQDDDQAVDVEEGQHADQGAQLGSLDRLDLQRDWRPGCDG